MPATYEPIATTTLSSAQAGVTFSSIPSTYTDLIVVFMTSTVVNSRACTLTFNSDTGNNYSRTLLYGNGTSAASSRQSSVGYIAFLDIAGTDNSANNSWFEVIHIMNYSNTTTNKTVLIRDTGKGETAAIVGLWRSTSAITSLTVGTTNNDTWSSGNIFTLYGIKAA